MAMRARMHIAALCDMFPERGQDIVGGIGRAYKLQLVTAEVKSSLHCHSSPISRFSICPRPTDKALYFYYIVIMSLNATSPGCWGITAAPDYASLPEIPTNITTILKGNTPQIYSSMQTCCAPSEVHTIKDGCLLYCEVPKSAGVSAKDAEVLLSQLTHCIARQSNSTAGGTGVHVAVATRSSGSLKVGVLVLVASLLVSGL